MARADNETGSLRFSRRESERVIAALFLSLLAHLIVWGGYEVVHKLGLWQKSRNQTAQASAKKFPLQAQIAHEAEPDIFVDVSHADADAPKQTKFYSNKNSHAANAETANANVPKLNGRQPDVPKTENVPKQTRPKEAPKTDDTPQLSKLQPTMPPPQPDLAKLEMPKPQLPGDLDPLKPKENSPTQSPTQPEPRPRTIRQALAQRHQLPGEEMKQAGGVNRRALWSSLDAKATPFGDYDRAIIEAVQQRWYDLLDSHKYAQDRSGKVILSFKLKMDGSIIEMHTLENTVGELLGYLCQEAIEEAAPFAKWPSDMVHEIGSNYREITFTFYYY